MNSYTVYMHITPSGKRYVGITSRDPALRWGANGCGYKGQAFENAVRKYGWNNIQHLILFTGLTKEEAEQKEIELIAEYKTTQSRYGYNVENGGKAVGRFTEETKRKISQSRQGIAPWNKEIPRTEEEKRKMSLSHIGKTSGEANGNFGKHISDETKRKISEARKGQPSHFKGRHQSEEVKQRLSEVRSLAVIRVEDGRKYTSIKEASHDVKVSSTSICNCLKGKTNRAGGYHWMYVND